MHAGLCKPQARQLWYWEHMTATAHRVDLNQILAGAQLPALPQSAIRLLELSQDPSNGPAEFTPPIEADPGLTSQILKFVNSSYFGFSREITSIKHAIALVGIRTIKNFALWTAVFSLMPNPKCGPFDLKLLWQDSLRRALFARALGRSLGAHDPDELFSAALLQDMAIPVLAKEMSAVYAKLLEYRREGAVRLSDLERKYFGWSHAEAGAQLARQWRMPAEFVDLIGHHTDVDAALDERAGHPGRLAVALSALLPATADPGWPEAARFEATYAACHPAGSSAVLELLAQLDQEFGAFAPLLNLEQPARSLVETYQVVHQSA
jgi:HD-like signal output (HDOD) protein